MRILKISLYLFCVFVFFEFIFRLTNPFGINYYNRAYKYLKSCKDTGMGYYLNGKDCNGYGLRCHEIKEKEKKRIFLLGDSIVYGLGVKKDQTFATLLDKALDYEVINVGMGGWNTRNEYLWLKQEGLSLEPDLVILYITNNDIENVYAGRIPDYPLWQRVIYNSYVLSTVFYIKRNLFRVLWGRTSFDTNMTLDANEIAEKALNGIINLSPTLIVCMYGSVTVQRTDTMQFFLNILKENKVPTFFIPEKLYSDEYYISTIDHHPNEKGHEYIANVTYAVIKQLEKLGKI